MQGAQRKRPHEAGVGFHPFIRIRQIAPRTHVLRNFFIVIRGSLHFRGIDERSLAGWIGVCVAVNKA